jgi:hypothetical protein
LVAIGEPVADNARREEFFDTLRRTKNNSKNRPVEDDGDTNALEQGLQSGAIKHPETPMDMSKEIPMTANENLLAPMDLSLALSTASEAYERLDAATNAIHAEYRRSAPLSRTVGPDCCADGSVPPPSSFTTASPPMVISCIVAWSSPKLGSGVDRRGDEDMIGSATFLFRKRPLKNFFSCGFM